MSPGSSSRETPASRGASSFSFLLGNEEEQLQAMLRELLAAFPTQTEQSELNITRVVTTTCTKVFVDISLTYYVVVVFCPVIRHFCSRECHMSY